MPLYFPPVRKHCRQRCMCFELGIEDSVQNAGAEGASFNQAPCLVSILSAAAVVRSLGLEAQLQALMMVVTRTGSCKSIQFTTQEQLKQQLQGCGHGSELVEQLCLQPERFGRPWLIHCLHYIICKLRQPALCKLFTYAQAGLQRERPCHCSPSRSS